MKYVAILILLILTGCSTTEPLVEDNPYVLSAEEMSNLMSTNSGDFIDYTSTITLLGDYYIDAKDYDGRNFYIDCGDHTNRYILTNGIFIEVKVKKPEYKIDFDPNKKAVD